MWTGVFTPVPAGSALRSALETDADRAAGYGRQTKAVNTVVDAPEELDRQPVRQRCKMSSQIYGIYVGLVYLTPLFGGLLADRVLGQRKSVFLGGTLIATGHLLMVFEESFLLALLFIVVGSGSFTSHISALVGKLY